MSKNIKLNVVRHGELLLEEVSKFPAKSKKAKSYILAHSESGHNHVLESKVDYEVSETDKEFLIRLFAPAKLVHQKTVNRHKDLVVKPGIYRIRHKQEYSPFTKVVSRIWD